MAISIPSSSLFSSTLGRFTVVGTKYIRSYFSQTPNPTDDQLEELKKETECPVPKLKIKFSKMRTYYSKRKKATDVNHLPTQPQTFCQPSSSSQSQELSNPIQFINQLSKSEVADLKTHIYSKNKCDFTIYSKNLDDEITPEELITFISVTPEDGKFFKDWLSCYVSAAFHKTVAPPYSITKLRRYSKSKCLDAKLRNFCNTKGIKSIGIMNHHVILRCKLKKKLPNLTAKDCGKTASHMCDTKNCLRPEHLIIESMAKNNSRHACPGVILILQPQAPSKPKKIMQIKPCHHGINHRKAKGNFLKFSCRKIQVMIKDDDSIQYIKKVL